MLKTEGRFQGFWPFLSRAYMTLATALAPLPLGIPPRLDIWEMAWTWEGDEPSYSV